MAAEEQARLARRSKRRNSEGRLPERNSYEGQNLAPRILLVNPGSHESWGTAAPRVESSRPGQIG